MLLARCDNNNCNGTHRFYLSSNGASDEGCNQSLNCHVLLGLNRCTGRSIGSADKMLDCRRNLLIALFNIWAAQLLVIFVMTHLFWCLNFHDRSLKSAIGDESWLCVLLAKSEVPWAKRRHKTRKSVCEKLWKLSWLYINTRMNLELFRSTKESKLWRLPHLGKILSQLQS